MLPFRLFHWSSLLAVYKTPQSQRNQSYGILPTSLFSFPLPQQNPTSQYHLNLWEVFVYLFVFLRHLSHSPVWSQTSYITEGDLELLILPSLLLKLLDYRCAPRSPVLCRAGSRTQGSVQASTLPTQQHSQSPKCLL